MKYKVDLDFWKCMTIEADSHDEAIMKALIKLTNNPNDFFTAEDEIANIILDNFENSSYATEIEDE